MCAKRSFVGKIAIVIGLAEVSLMAVDFQKTPLLTLPRNLISLAIPAY